MKYDYIIAGAGAAGLSLLYRILKNPKLNSKKIAVIDSSKKNKNDRTWCFWEDKPGLFEQIITHEWKTLEFMTSEFQRKVDLKDYSYKMIQGIDFYDHILNFAKGFENVDFKIEKIKDIKQSNGTTSVETEQNTYFSEIVFNSTSLFNPTISKENSLLQHFVGWTIKTDNAVFDPKVGTLMDFRLNQKNGTTFMYVLPTSPTEALVEYTLFSKEILQPDEYRIALEDYITNYLKINSYEISHTEFGVIPMSLANFDRNTNQNKNIINIGTAGGFTKASSGYTFQFIQKNTAQIVERLQNGENPNLPKTSREKIYEWYDRTLIDVIMSERMGGKEIFATMFKSLPMDLIFKFLGNESSFIDDFKIMRTLPVQHFLRSGLNQI